MNDHQIVETASKYILALGPEALTIVAIIALGYIPRFVTWEKDGPESPWKGKLRDFIPLFCILVGPVVYPFLGDPGKISFTTANPVVAQVLIGLVLGVLAWALHDQVISRIEALVFRKARPDYTDIPKGQ